MTSPGTISAVVPFVIGEVARTVGLDPASVLVGSGVAADVRPHADEHVPVTAYFEVWRRVMAHAASTLPLRVASTFKLEDHEVFGFLAMSCETLGRAYERTAAYRGLYCVGARWDLEVGADATRLIWCPWAGALDDPGYRAAMDFAVADMADAIRQLGRDAPRPREVRLRHAAPADPEAYAAWFGVAPRFGAALDELVYSPGLTDLPITTFNSRLRDYFDAECHKLVGKLGATTTVDRARAQLVTAMDGGDSSLEAVARRLGLSTRSLQRRLAEEGTRYQDLLDEVRAEFAKRYLARGTVSASEVAYLIGFTEPPAFFKAFKRWTGKTPREFQQRRARQPSASLP